MRVALLHDITSLDFWRFVNSDICSGGFRGGQGARPPPFQTIAYIVYYLEGKCMSNLTKYLLNLIKKVQFFSKFSARFARQSCFFLFF